MGDIANLSFQFRCFVWSEDFIFRPLDIGAAWFVFVAYGTTWDAQGLCGDWAFG